MVFKFLPFLVLILGCTPSGNEKLAPAKKQFWNGTFQTDHHEIPFRFYSEGKSIVLVNHDEEIKLTETRQSGDSTWYSFPQYGGDFIVVSKTDHHISGLWQKEGYAHVLPFSASPEESRNLPDTASATDYYHVQFIKLNGDTVNATGMFNDDAHVITGSFLTSTGDYRSFEGSVVNSKFALSHFDGRYLNYALFEKKDDQSITGVFQSNNNEPYTWSGVRLDQQPDVNLEGLITARDSAKPEFIVKSLDGVQKQFTQDDFYGQVTVVQVFGSWCPNCHDELSAFREFNDYFDSSSLVFMPVAFEYDSSLTACKERIARLFKHLNVPFEAYYGGVAKKSVSAQVFPFLSDITAYPTSVYIDKRGNIRKIQSGFTGPGTGAYYEEYKKETRQFLAELLAE